MSTYPNTKDNYPTDRAVTDPKRLVGPDVDEHSDAINKIQDELGTNPSGTYDTVVERLDDIVAGTGHVVEDEGTPLPARANLDFQGAGVMVTDDAGNDTTVVTVPGGGGGGAAHEIQDEGTPETDRSALNFTGAAVSVSDDAGNDATVVAVDAPTSTQFSDHLSDATDAHDASAISFVPAGTIAATNVQAAIEEVASEATGGGGSPGANDKGFVNHGAVAGTARPSGYGSVEWLGSVTPTNATDNDTWIQTA